MRLSVVCAPALAVLLGLGTAQAVPAASPAVSLRYRIGGGYRSSGSFHAASFQRGPSLDTFCFTASRSRSYYLLHRFNPAGQSGTVPFVSLTFGPYRRGHTPFTTRARQASLLMSDGHRLIEDVPGPEFSPLSVHVSADGRSGTLATRGATVNRGNTAPVPVTIRLTWRCSTLLRAAVPPF